MKKLFALLMVFGMLGMGLTAQAEDYVIDSDHAHASINFRIQHLGYSWLYGRFDDFAGTFSYDEKHA